MIFQLVMLLMVVAFALCIWRLIRGPTVADILLASNVIWTMGVGVVLLLGDRYSPFLSDTAIPLALIAFVSTLAVCKYLERGRID
ncbi:MAG: monovalent cation/H+ antiporter complex subunit F [Candidatus Hadarchaeales archaeon]